MYVTFALQRGHLLKRFRCAILTPEHASRTTTHRQLSRGSKQISTCTWNGLFRLQCYCISCFVSLTCSCQNILELSLTRSLDFSVSKQTTPINAFLPLQQDSYSAPSILNHYAIARNPSIALSIDYLKVQVSRMVILTCLVSILAEGGCQDWHCF